MLVDVTPFKDVFGSNIYYDKSHNDYYKWSIHSKTDIDKFKSYISKYPSYWNKKTFFNK